MEMTSKENVIYKTKYDLIAYISIVLAIIIGAAIWMLIK